MILCLGLGRYSISIGLSLKVFFSKLLGNTRTWPAQYYTLLFSIRLPRILAAVAIGAGLSVAGAVYQSVFQNPLVSPDLLGVSSGACVGAASAILLGVGFIGTEVLAFVGGIAAVVLTVMLPKLIRRSSNLVLVLSGIIVSGLMTSVLGIIKYYADPDSELAAITYWQMGSFSGIDNYSFYLCLPLMVLCITVLMLLSWQIDVLSLGSQQAKGLGVNTRLIRGTTIICSTILTACAVSLCGTIGWVGLIIPHIGRMLSGSSNTRLLPLSACIGAIFMLVIDTVARITTDTEIPIGILTGMVGAPFFAWILYRQRNKL